MIVKSVNTSFDDVGGNLRRTKGSEKSSNTLRRLNFSFLKNRDLINNKILMYEFFMFLVNSINCMYNLLCALEYKLHL